MSMKKMCIVKYIFGDSYQEYIPLFLLSLFKVYPDYGTRIYLDRPMLPGVRKNVELFKDYDVTIIENYNDNLGLTKKARSFTSIGKCVRWLMYDEAFEEYDSIYVGDTDIIVCPEEKPMYEEHLNHCKFLNKPISNIMRVGALNKKLIPKLVARNIVKFGLGQSIKYYTGKETAVKKVSGLHFVKTKEYYPQLLKIRDNFIKELNLLAEGKSKRYNLCSFRDEVLLYDMMIACGFGLTEEAEPGYNISQDSNQYSYRPHHGLHLGSFRGDYARNHERENLMSDLYRSYYKFYCDLEKTEEYTKLQKEFSTYMQKVINEMHEFYKNAK